MIISHQYRLIFLKTHKTAGTSIEVFLSQVCGPNDVVTPIHPHVEPHAARNFTAYWNPWCEIVSGQGGGLLHTVRDVIRQRRYYNHMPARLARCRAGRNIWEDYYKFCVERDPWDKTLSHYCMMLDRSGGVLTLDEYIERGEFCSDWELYTDSSGDVIVDRVIRYESLAEDLSEVFAHVGIPFGGDLEVRAKSEHRAGKPVSRDLLNRSQWEAIATAFRREISYHGYENGLWAG